MAMATTVSAADIANTKRARVEPIALLYKSDEAIKLSNPELSIISMDIRALTRVEEYKKDINPMVNTSIVRISIYSRFNG